MILSLLNFIWIFISAFLFGFAACRILRHFNLIDARFPAPDLIFISGLAVLTAYAQWFSIFYRVGILAALSLVILNFFILIFLRRQISEWMHNLFGSCNIYKYALWILMGAVFFSIVASTAPKVYDTALYHNQAIQWIEKYGVVKGLGNLHNRLAYNSSFFALQALFGWSSLVGQSLHGMNCFVALLFSSYAIFRLFNRKKAMEESQHYYIEQFFNLLILLQIYMSADALSSPGTDFLSMLLILYLFSRWARNKKEIPFLFLMAVFGATVKLSVASLVMLGIPLCILVIKNRKWQQFLCYAAFCIFFAFPFFIRNILISGYVLYPSTAFDFFGFDWKMPAYTVNFDSQEIIVWGRRIYDVSKYHLPITSWVPAWINDMTFWERLLTCSQMFFIPLALYQIIRALMKRQNLNLAGMLSISLAGLLSWFFSAPLIRYGNVYLYLLPAILIGFYLQNHNFFIRWVPCILTVATLFLLFLIPAAFLPGHEVIRLYNPNDYEAYHCDIYEISPGVRIYYPDEIPECTGYDTFPSTPYPERFNVIELRGSDIKDGFRIKPELKDKKINTYGTILP